MAYKIYTKTGDTGNTSLIGGSRVLKSNIRIDAYGTIDELISFLGVLSDGIALDNEKRIIKEIQDRLFTIGSHLASAPHKDIKMALPDMHLQDITFLEQEMDKHDLILPELKSFILPGGLASASMAHVCRCVCRRAERICVAMQEVDEPIEPIVLQYLNRLSDYLFVLARYLSFCGNVQDNEWKPRM